MPLECEAVSSPLLATTQQAVDCTIEAALTDALCWVICSSHLVVCSCVSAAHLDRPAGPHPSPAAGGDGERPGAEGAGACFPAADAGPHRGALPAPVQPAHGAAHALHACHAPPPLDVACTPSG